MVREAPHYLKPLKSSVMPKRMAFFDVQTKSKPQRGGRVLSWEVGALATAHRATRSSALRETITVHGTPQALWAALDKFCLVKRRVVLWTFDLPEQLRTSQAMIHLPRLGWALETVVLEPGAAWALWRNDQRSLLMCDLKSWTPYEWERINNAMVANRTSSVTVPSGLSDVGVMAFNRCRTIQEAATQIINWLTADDLGTFKPTGSGQSYSAFRRKWLHDRILVHDDVERLAIERRSMWAGRVEAWRHGRLDGGQFIELDMKAAYARIASECNVPTIALGEMRNPTIEKVLAATPSHAFLCHVQLETEMPIAPVSVGSHTLWPVGKLDTWVWNPELSLIAQFCPGARITKAYKYRAKPALQGFASHVLAQIDVRDVTHGPMPGLVYKHWSRTLVGRFGLRYRSWIPFADNDTDDLQMVTYIDFDDSSMTDLLCVGDRMLLLGDLTESVESVPQIPAWIMSECRRRLFMTMYEIGLERVVYVDTDSIIIDSRGDAKWAAEVERRYRGLWARKAVHRQLDIRGPRNLDAGTDRRMSGLPLGAIQTRPLEYRGEVMRSIRQSMRGGQLGTVTVNSREFKFTALDIRRGHNKDGTTFPFWIGESCTPDIAA